MAGLDQAIQESFVAPTRDGWVAGSVAGHSEMWVAVDEQPNRSSTTEFLMEVTRTLARYVVNSKASDIPDAVKREGNVCGLVPHCVRDRSSSSARPA